MQGFTQRLGRRLQTRLAEKSSNPGGTVDRFDLKLWQHRISGPHDARVLIGFSPSLGIPTKTDLDDWIIKQSSVQMRLVPESVRIHHSQNLITATVIKIPQVRPMEHAASMLAVSANTLMDEKEALWEVRKTEDGNSFLARVEREDIDAILSAREKETRTASVANRPTFEALTDAGILDPEVGDHVSFMYKGAVYRGKVTDRHNDKVKVALSDKEVEVMTPDILDVKETTEEFKNEHKQRLINIFTQMYGDRGFATQLVNL